VLRTELGRVELLLAPGVFLRIAENTAVRMINNSLQDTKLELLNGAALLEAVEVLSDFTISLRLGEATVMVRKNGLYRINSAPAELRVYDGAAEVVGGDRKLTAKKSSRVALYGQYAISKFDTESGDPLHRWSSRRAGYLALANISAANSVRQSDVNWRTSGWLWNPFYGMMTFVPVRAGLYSPFGYGYFCPRNVYAVYAPRVTAPAVSSMGFSGPRYDANRGYTVTSQRSYDGYSPSAGSTGAAAAPSAPAESPRSAETATPRGGEGGGRSQ